MSHTLKWRSRLGVTTKTTIQRLCFQKQKELFGTNFKDYFCCFVIFFNRVDTNLCLKAFFIRPFFLFKKTFVKRDSCS